MKTKIWSCTMKTIFCFLNFRIAFSLTGRLLKGKEFRKPVSELVIWDTVWRHDKYENKSNFLLPWTIRFTMRKHKERKSLCNPEVDTTGPVLEIKISKNGSLLSHSSSWIYWMNNQLTELILAFSLLIIIVHLSITRLAIA